PVRSAGIAGLPAVELFTLFSRLRPEKAAHVDSGHDPEDRSSDPDRQRAAIGWAQVEKACPGMGRSRNVALAVLGRDDQFARARQRRRRVSPERLLVESRYRD